MGNTEAGTSHPVLPGMYLRGWGRTPQSSEMTKRPQSRVRIGRAPTWKGRAASALKPSPDLLQSLSECTGLCPTPPPQHPASGIRSTNPPDSIPGDPKGGLAGSGGRRRRVCEKIKREVRTDGSREKIRWRGRRVQRQEAYSLPEAMGNKSRQSWEA